MPAHAVEHGALAVGGRRHRRMPAFAGQRDPAFPGRDQAGDAEPRSRAEHAERRAGGRSPAADLQPMFRRKVRQGQRQSGEVVDHLEAVKPELRLQRRDRKAPGMVGHRDPVAGDCRGDRDRPLTRHRQCPALAKIGGDRVGDRRMIRDGEGARMQHHSFRRNQAETGVGGADVSDEPSLGVGVARTHNRDASDTEQVRPIRVNVSQASVVRRTSIGGRV